MLPPLSKGDKMKKIISIFLATLIAFSFSVISFAESENELRFGSDGTFTVLQISDTQDDHYPAYDMVNLVKLSIEQTDPDLIVFTGDIVEDSRIGDIGIDDENGREGVEIDGDYEATLANTKAACEAVFAAAEEAGIPFAVAQGNNDYACGVTNEDWMKIYSSYENCIVFDESPDEGGAIDYNLEIKASDSDKTVFNIWLMDTGRNGVLWEQTLWYKTESAALKAANGNEPVPSILFQHIPVPDISNLFEECNFWDEGARIVDGKCYRLNKEIANGYNASAPKPGLETVQFKAWTECGDILGAYFGHWHTEGYTGTWKGIELGMTYGAEFAKPGPYGVRVFTLHEDDIKNYGNELYTYEGSVKNGDARLELQVDEPYEEYDSFIEELVAGIRNTFNLIFIKIKSLLA